MESTKQTVGAMSKALPEEVWIKVGGKPSIFILAFSVLQILSNVHVFYNEYEISESYQVWSFEMHSGQCGSRLKKKVASNFSYIYKRV